MVPLRVTGVQSVNDSVVRFEIEVHMGAGRIRFQQGPGPLPHTQVGALVIDDVPVVLALAGHGMLALPSPATDPLPSVTSLPALDEASVMALSPLLRMLGDGLYAVTTTPTSSVRAAAGFAVAHRDDVIDVATASSAGVPVLASLGDGVRALLAGRAAAKRGEPAWLIGADVMIDAPGFLARMHDRGAREAFARAPSGALDDHALRDALAHLRALNDSVDVGPFSEDRVEPAAQQARALVWDLRAEDGVDNVSDTWRESNGDATEFRARVKVKSVQFEVAFTTRDGRHIDEVVVRSGVRFRATGLRPAARSLARTLRQLADEGG